MQHKTLDAPTKVELQKKIDACIAKGWTTTGDIYEFYFQGNIIYYKQAMVKP